MTKAREIAELGQKLTVDASGNIDIAGNITSDGLTVDGSGVISDTNSGAVSSLLTLHNEGTASGTMAELKLAGGNGLSNRYAYIRAFNGGSSNGNAHALFFGTNPASASPENRMVISSGGDISFYEDTGSTPKFFWDASAESLGIGTTAINGKLEIANSDQTNGVTLSLTNSFSGGDWSSGDIIGTIDFRTGDTSTTQPVRGQIKVFDDETGSGTYAAKNAMSFSTAAANSLTERMRISSDGSVGIGTISSLGRLTVAPASNSTASGITVIEASAGTVYGAWSCTGTETLSLTAGSTGSDDTTLRFLTANNGSESEAMRITSSGSVGIGTSSIESDATLHIDGTDTVLLITEDSEGEATLRFGDTQGSLSQSFAISYDTGGNSTFFRVNDTTVGRWNPSNDFIVGGDAAESPYILVIGNDDSTKAGVGLRSTGYVAASRYQGEALNLNRMNNDGDIALFRKDGSVVGSIGSNSGLYSYYTGGSAGLMMRASDIIPTTGSGAFADNSKDLGDPLIRFDDIYATNGTIQTSDRNEKQQIASLNTAEMGAAKAISQLFKTFKWNDSVAEKGADAARTHAGVIAQEVEAAMTDAGLDAGDYAFFISTTWWETQTDVPAVEAVDEVVDDEGNVVTEAVEAKAAYTRTDTYETAEEAPEGATERTRKGIRYPQLLSFVGAATEQRLADIEARLTAIGA